MSLASLRAMFVRRAKSARLLMAVSNFQKHAQAAETTHSEYELNAASNAARRVMQMIVTNLDCAAYQIENRKAGRTYTPVFTHDA